MNSAQLSTAEAQKSDIANICSVIDHQMFIIKMVMKGEHS